MNQPLVPCPDQCGSFTTAEHAEQIRAAMAALHHDETSVSAEMETKVEDAAEAIEQDDAASPELAADVQPEAAQPDESLTQPPEAAEAAKPGQDPFARSRVIQTGPAW